MKPNNIKAKPKTAVKQSAGVAIAHTNKYVDNDPAWDTVSKNLPPECFAVAGDTEDPKTWLYPHHYIVQPSHPTNEGYPTQGTMVLHHDQFMAQSKKAESDKNAAAQAHFEDHFKSVDPDHDGSFLPNRTGLNNYSAKAVTQNAFFAPVVSFDTEKANEDGTIPIKVVALSGEVLDRPEWGACVQDLAGMQHADRIILDYKHDDCELLGFIDSFDVSSGKLILGGCMIPQQTHRRVEEICTNHKAGVPYEASIYFPPSTPDDMRIDVVEEGKTAQVNGKTVVAPLGGLTIFRKWVLRGVACCPHGADRQTATYLQKAGEQATVNIMVRNVKENTMTEEEKQAKAKLEADAKAKQDADEAAKLAQSAADEGAKDEGEDGAEEPDGDECDKDTLKKMGAVMAKYSAKFGKHGAEFLSKGMTYAEALDAYADIARKAMEASEAPAGEKKEEVAPVAKAVEQSAGAPVKFAQGEDAKGATIDGIPAKFAQRVHSDAVKYGWDAERVKLMLEVAKKEFKRQQEMASDGQDE